MRPQTYLCSSMLDKSLTPLNCKIVHNFHVLGMNIGNILEFNLRCFTVPACMLYTIGAARGNTANVPPSKLKKIIVEKRCYFLMLYFYQQLFKKSSKIQFFYWIFIRKFSRFSQNFPTIWIFFQTCKRLTQGFKILLKNRQKYCILLF